MARDLPPQPFVWDALNIDTIIKTLNLSLLSPAFAMWTPVICYAQGYHTHTPVFQSTLVYFAVTLVLSLIPWLNNIYHNKSWRFGMMGITSNRKLDWEDHIVVVTGGANGLGKIITETLAIRGVTVVVLDIADYESQWDDTYYYKCDVSNREEVMKAAAKIHEEIGDPTILINNAGIVNGKLTLDLSEADVKRSFGVNNMAHFWTTQAFLPAMLENDNGHIVTVASALGYYGVAQLADYSATKAAAIAFHESLQAEIRTRYKRDGVRCSLLTPGHMATDMFAAVHTSPLVQFFFPTVLPHEVAKKVIAALDRCEGGTITMPFWTHFSWSLRASPLWLIDIVKHITGADTALTHNSAKVEKKEQ